MQKTFMSTSIKVMFFIFVLSAWMALLTEQFGAPVIKWLAKNSVLFSYSTILQDAGAGAWNWTGQTNLMVFILFFIAVSALASMLTFLTVGILNDAQRTAKRIFHLLRRPV